MNCHSCGFLGGVDRMDFATSSGVVSIGSGMVYLTGRPRLRLDSDLLCRFGERLSFVEYVVGRSVVKALAGALLVKVAQVGGDPLSRLLYCLVRALGSPVIGGTNIYPLILAALEQNICCEGASLRKRFFLEIPDSVFRFVNPLDRFRFSKSGAWSVIRPVALFRDLYTKVPENQT